MRIWRSGGGFDLDIISEVLDAAHEAHGCAGLVITSKVVRSEVAQEGTVAQHMVDGGEDRCGDRDGSLFWSASCFEAQELGLEIGVLGPRRRKGALHTGGPCAELYLPLARYLIKPLGASHGTRNFALATRNTHSDHHSPPFVFPSLMKGATSWNYGRLVRHDSSDQLCAQNESRR